MAQRVLLDKVLKKYKMSRYRFAKELGIDPKNSPRMFRDDFNPRVSDLETYAKAIGCKIRELLPNR